MLYDYVMVPVDQSDDSNANCKTEWKDAHVYRSAAISNVLLWIEWWFFTISSEQYDDVRMRLISQ